MKSLQVSWLRIILDCVALITLFTFSQVLLSALTPFQAGFFCSDTSVTLPFKPSTVSNLHLALICIPLPFLVFTMTELVRLLLIKTNRDRMTSRKPVTNQLNLCCLGYKDLPESLVNIWVNTGIFFLGILVTNCLTNISKLVIGRLRPNFLDVCKPEPNIVATLCNQKSYLVPGIDFKCTNTDTREVNGCRKSFPSGHSSLAFFTCIFLVLFINRAWNCRYIGLVKHFAQFLLTALALFTALSRVQDNKHHPTDVLAGSVLGIAMAYLTYYALLVKYFDKRDYRVEYEIVRLDEDSRTQSRINGDNLASVSITSNI